MIKSNNLGSKKCIAIVLAGGRGSRMGSDIPKQYIEVEGYPLIYYSLKAFEKSFVDEIILVCASGDEEYCRQQVVEMYDLRKVSHIVAGGKERYHSVANGLAAVDDADIVFIHDGARPFIDESILQRAYEETCAFGATVVAVPSKDTVKIIDAEGYAVSTPSRDSVWIMQTPQSFDYKLIKKAYDELLEKEDELSQNGITITDDAMVMEHFGDCKVKMVMGSYKNIKITTPEDIVVARSYIRASKECNG